MTRFKLVLEYDGGPFVGWQRQENGPSVQAALEEAVTAFSGEEVAVAGAGRTDSGVHALAQVAHFDLARASDADTVRDALNFHLKPRPIAVLDAVATEADFHARFSATGREYRYRIVNRRAPLALEAGRAWQVPVPLDAEALRGLERLYTVRLADLAKEPLAPAAVRTARAVHDAFVPYVLERRPRSLGFLRETMRRKQAVTRR